MKTKKRHPSHSELNELLDGIETGQSVDVVRLKSLLSKNNLSLNNLLHFLGAPAQNLSQGVIPSDIVGWGEWRHRVVGRKIDLTDKVSAAATGHSHSVSNQLSMIIYWPYKADHPTLASFNGENWHLPVTPTENLLIIENEALFLMRPAMKLTIKKWFPDIKGSLDWVFASGNSIARSSNKGFLESYKHIFVLTDIDLGGLKILMNLSSLLSGSSSMLIPVYPDDVEIWLSRYGHPINPTHLNKLLKLLPSLSGESLKVANIIIRKGLVLEQEVYLRSET